MTTWLPCLLAIALVAVESRRLVLGHLRRELWRRRLAGAAVVTVGRPAVFEWSPGMDFAFSALKTAVDHPEHGSTRDQSFVKGYVVKVNYATGKLWVADA